MAKDYLEKLAGLISRLNIEKEVDYRIEVKHLFTGAALYVDNIICASWSPVGLAFKLAEKEVASLIRSGKAKPLKYFPKGHVKKGYALFESPEKSRPSKWKAYFVKAMKHSHE
jgi:TfoX/Sxy family transcriptional regulator of competence genes